MSNVGVIVKSLAVFSLLFVFIMNVACTPAQPVAAVGPSGKVVYEINCLDDEKFCDPQGKELCPDGYKILRDKSHIVAIWRGVDVVNRIRFELTIECQ